MNITIIEPYFTGSHRQWAEGYRRHSSHRVDILSLEGRHWKWRMHGGAVSLAAEFSLKREATDLLLATDMLDLAAFLALTRKKSAGVKTAVYFHENQLSYPWPGKDPDTESGRDAHYGFINYTTALCADAVLFNSAFHLDSFLSGLGPFLRRFPDHRKLDNTLLIREKSLVLPLGLDLSGLDKHRIEKNPADPPLLLWNHRWEYDKGPEEFFEAMFKLKDRGLMFQLAVLGESYAEKPAVFDQAHERLADRTVQFEYAKSRDEYARWLWRADILPVTSRHDFFGAAATEAIHCGCFPILPDRLAFPEHIPAERRGEFLYSGFNELLLTLVKRIRKIDETRKSDFSGFVSRYDWSRMAPEYDRVLSYIAKG